MSTTILQTLLLKKQQERRLLAGHLWVFSNEVDTAKTPLNQFQVGQLVNVHSHSGKPLGTAYINPHALICARVISRRSNTALDHTWFVNRLEAALALRKHLGLGSFYRLVFGEADFLPGIVIDRYGDVLVLQIGTAAMEHHRATLLTALQEVLKPISILLRNDMRVRQLENLPAVVEPLFGTPPQEITLEENGAVFHVNIWEGQKTGWFYDQRDNRVRALRYIQPGSRVLDVFSYTGSWAIPTARSGANVTCIDSSHRAIEDVQKNAALNHVSERITCREGDAFTELTNLHTEKQMFDVVFLDPPAFIQRQKDYKVGLAAYERLNKLAMQLLPRHGLLMSASCSHHLSQEDLLNTIRRASVKIGRGIQVLERGQQAPDHPRHPAMPETDYLKSFWVRMLD